MRPLQYARRLGLALPLLLLPSVAWHLLRTWGWAVAFPARSPGARHSPALFRVRLAADAISFFTVRGPTGEPLKVLLLCGPRAAGHVRPRQSRPSGWRSRVVSMAVAGVASAVRRAPACRCRRRGTRRSRCSRLAPSCCVGFFALVRASRYAATTLGRLVARARQVAGRRARRRARRGRAFHPGSGGHLLALLRGDATPAGRC